MIGWAGSTTLTSNSPVPWLLNWAPTRAMYLGELRKQYEAQWIGANPPPFSTYSSRAFSCSGSIFSELA